MAKRALIVGVSYNQGTLPGTLKPLKSTLLDAEDWTMVLKNRFSFHPNSLTTLVEKDNYEPPTYSNTIDALRKKLQKTATGDHCVLVFSGHGIKLDGGDGNEGVLLLPDDGNSYKDSVLSDQQLADLVAEAQPEGKASLTIILDACCAFGMVDRVFKHGGVSAKLNIVFFAACSPNGTAYAWSDNGVFSSAAFRYIAKKANSVIKNKPFVEGCVPYMSTQVPQWRWSGYPDNDALQSAEFLGG